MPLNEPEKIGAICPECGEKNEILWFRKNFSQINTAGTAGIAGKKFISRRAEKVQGKCTKCEYKFTLDDL